jgi:integrase
LLTFNTVKAGCGNKSLIAFLLDFWDYENSAYIKEKLLHGHSESRRHCIEATRYVKSKWAPYFKKRQLDSLTRQDFRDFALSLRETRTPKSINNVLSVGIVGIRWAFAEGMIPEDPTRGLIRFTGGESKRDILTEAETVKLFSIKWEDKRAYAGALLAATGGLRAGEVRGIRKEDIGDLILTVNHSWSDFDGLKSTKTGEVRRVPLLPQVRALLIELLEDSPFKELENPFVFYSEVPDKPLSDKVLLNNLKREIKKAGIDLAGRAVVFHSFRHFYASRISEIMSAEEVMRVTGHRSRAVFDSYASHIEDKNLEEMGKAGAKVFKKILPFIKKGA